MNILPTEEEKVSLLFKKCME